MSENLPRHLVGRCLDVALDEAFEVRSKERVQDLMLVDREANLAACERIWACKVRRLAVPGLSALDMLGRFPRHATMRELWLDERGFATRRILADALLDDAARCEGDRRLAGLRRLKYSGSLDDWGEEGVGGTPYALIARACPGLRELWLNNTSAAPVSAAAWYQTDALASLTALTSLSLVAYRERSAFRLDAVAGLGRLLLARPPSLARLELWSSAPLPETLALLGAARAAAAALEGFCGRAPDEGGTLRELTLVVPRVGDGAGVISAAAEDDRRRLLRGLTQLKVGAYQTWGMLDLAGLNRDLGFATTALGPLGGWRQQQGVWDVLEELEMWQAFANDLAEADIELLDARLPALRRLWVNGVRLERPLSLLQEHLRWERLSVLNLPNLRTLAILPLRAGAMLRVVRSPARWMVRSGEAAAVRVAVARLASLRLELPGAGCLMLSWGAATADAAPPLEHADEAADAVRELAPLGAAVGCLKLDSWPGFAGAPPSALTSAVREALPHLSPDPSDDCSFVRLENMV